MGTGGSRLGAGRPGGTRKAEQSLSLDIRHIARKGLLRPGAYSWRWTNNYGEHVGSIALRVTHVPEQVILSYSWTPYGHDPRNVECVLRIDRTPCNYGGTRPWFRCPSCWRRCAVAYFGASGGRYACRHCARIAYLSQGEDGIGRLWRKQTKIERKMARGAHEWDGRKKPKGMHQQTFDRLCDQIWELEMRREKLFELQFAPLLRRFGSQEW